jgi:hypothetical protein
MVNDLDGPNSDAQILDTIFRFRSGVSVPFHVDPGAEFRPTIYLFVVRGD